jgi:cell division initiation protein
MKVTPLDIRKQTFKKVLRGADPEEVRMFLELVASEYEKVVQDNAMMAEKLSYQEERLDEYRELEKSLRNSLVTAERITTESREASDREAERIISDAQKRAERILEDSRERLQRLVSEVENLRNKKEVYVRRFRTMIESQLGVLQEHEQQFDEIETLEVSARDLLVRSNRSEDSGYPARRSAEIVPIRSARDQARAAERAAEEPEERRSPVTSRIAEARALAARRSESRPVREEGPETDRFEEDSPSREGERRELDRRDLERREPERRELDRRETERTEERAAMAERAALTARADERADGTEEEEDEAFFEVQQRREGFFEFEAEAAGEKRGASTRRNGY